MNVWGDFNDILNANVKRGGAPVSKRKCDNFESRIDQCMMMNFGFTGHRFTWRAPIYHGGQRIYERLDRELSNDQ